MRLALKIAALLWGAIGFAALLVYLRARWDLALPLIDLGRTVANAQDASTKAALGK
jgi:hypothetical protein